jgi:hypothetical protein
MSRIHTTAYSNKLNDAEIFYVPQNLISGQASCSLTKKETHFKMLSYLDFIAEFFAPYAIASFPCIRGVSRLYNEALNSPKRYGTLTEKMGDKIVFFVILSSTV